MIKIEERIPNKVSGVSSLFLSFSFNQEVINIIKTCSKYVYDKKTYTWEVPAGELAYLLDNLTYLDDITLILMQNNNFNSKLTEKEIAKYNPPGWFIELFH